MDLNNKVAIITGAASGLGLATANHLSACGVSCVLTDINGAALKAAAKKLDAIACVVDVENEQSIREALSKTIEHYQALHIVVNCAGIAPGERVVGRDGPHQLATFNKVIAINLVGTFNVLRLAAEQMMAQQPVNEDQERGVIINTASVAAYDGQIGQAAYSASKAGVVGMTLPIAREMAKFGIRINSIAPGIMQTPMMAAMTEKVQTNLLSGVVFPKRMGLAEEYATTVEFIAKNSYLNAELIRLDAGIRMSA
jgi:NAD(P)-dependent dehydrogenase (short-subunit alcohol dehydrogenase family)